MSKNSKNDNIIRLFEVINKAYHAGGCTLEEVLELDPSERPEMVDYESIDGKFDSIMSLDTLAKKIKAFGILQRFSLLYISRSIAREYLKTNKLDFCDIELTNEEKILSAIYAFAYRRGIVSKPEDYVDKKGPILERMVLQRLNGHLAAEKTMLETDAQDISLPTLRAERFREISATLANAASIIKKYPQSHTVYVDKLSRPKDKEQ